MRLFPSFVLAVALTATACDGGSTTTSTPATSGASQQDIGEVLAEVNGQKVGSKQFLEAAARKQPASGDSLSDDEKAEVLDRLVDEVLLYQKALTLGLDKDPKVQKVMVNALLRQEVYASIRNTDFPDEELKAYYEEHKDEFVVPEKAQIKRILIKTGDERSDEDASAEAARIHGLLKADIKKFKELAAAHSEDPYRRRGGDVGFVPRTGKPGLDQAVVDKAFELDVNQLSDPFQTSEGYNVLYIANKRDRVERTFQQMKGSVLRKVKNERLKTLYDDYVANLRTNAKIQIDQDKLAVQKVEAGRGGRRGLNLNPAAGAGDDEGGTDEGGTNEGEE